ncbi:MAG: ABC transporter ATP-binding protein [Pseudomonadota bacterium]
MIVTLKDLVLEYQMGDETLKILDIPEWSVKKGGLIAVSGPSGSGKSTLLNIIAGLLLPTEGTVMVAGSELTRLREAERDHFRADSIGYIFQNFNLLQGYTAIENVLLGMTFSTQKSNKETAQELLSMVGLSHRINHFPRELSIGEQQRVAIARALSKQPELILADEPTGSLDPLHTEEVISKLREVSSKQGCTLLLVSHEQSVVAEFEEQISFLELNQAFKQEEREA